jgi:hypothetical protein
MIMATPVIPSFIAHLRPERELMKSLGIRAKDFSS